MTDWGYYLSALLKDRHFDNLTQFAAEIENHDRPITPQMISKYRLGRAPLWFVADCIEVLEMTNEEADKFIGLWLDTMPPGERSLQERMAALLLRGSRDMKEVQDYEHEREQRDGE